MTLHKKNKTKKFSKKWLVGGLVLLIVTGGIVGWMWHEHTSAPKKIALDNGQTVVADSDVPGSEDKDKNNADATPGTIGGSTNSKDYSSNVPGQTSSGVQPTKPTGQFVSNPGKPGDPAVTTSTAEETVCITTPGVYCEIHFTSGSTVKKSPKYKTDGNGSTLWEWTPKKYGLTPGTWKVTAIAINGDKTASANGPQLVIKK